MRSYVNVNYLSPSAFNQDTWHHEQVIMINENPMEKEWSMKQYTNHDMETIHLLEKDVHMKYSPTKISSNDPTSSNILPLKRG